MYELGFYEAKQMDFFRSNWYYIGGIIFVALAYFIGLFGGDISPIQRILILSFMALLVHQFEEYGVPGGFPAIYNIVLSGEEEAADRYPLNRNSAFIINIFLAYPLYILAIIFPELIWYGIATMLFGIAQIIVHGIVVNAKMKSFYNPGLGAVVFLHIPIGLYYFWYITVNELVQPWHWIVGLICLPIFAFLAIALPSKLLQNKESPYSFSEPEMKRFNVLEKMTNRNK
jgi:hypothetical protein